MLHTALSQAEDKIQAFVNSSGRIVFSNQVENSPAPVANASAPVTTPPTEATPAAPRPAANVGPATSNGRIPPALDSLVDSISKTHGVDPALVKAVMKTESGFNRWAVSPKGAMGLMQLIPGTGRRFGVRDFFDPQQNIEGGVRYLKFLINKFEGNLDLSLAAYNAGENLVQRLGRIPQIRETRDYVRKVRSNYSASGMSTQPLISKVADVDEEVVEPDELPQIFRTVDQRGVVHFSNIEPPN